MMKNIYIITVLILLFAGYNSVAQNNTNILIHNINYSVDSVDMWGGAEPTFLDFDYSLIDLCFGQGCETDPSIHEIMGTEEVGIRFDLDLFMYLNSTLSMHGFSNGYVGIDFPVEITLDFPDDDSFDHGAVVPIQSNFIVREGWALETNFPKTGTVALDLEYGFDVDMAVSVESMGEEVVPPVHLIDVQYPTVPQFTTPVPHDSIAVFYLNSETGEYAYPWIDEVTGNPYLNTGFLAAGDPMNIEIPEDFGVGLTADVKIPNVETEDRLDGQCLRADGQDDWLSVNWNLLQFLHFIGNATGQTAVGNVANVLEGGTTTYPIYEDYVINIEYFILHASLEMTMSLVQEFSFCPEIDATLHFATPLPFNEITRNNTLVQAGESNEITFTINNTLLIEYPCYNWDSLQVYDVTYNIRSGFENKTYNNLRLGMDLEILHVNISVPGLDNVLSTTTIPELILPEIEGGYENPNDIVAQSYEIGGFAVERYRETETMGTRSGTQTRNINVCIPTDCGAFVDESFEIGDVDLGFLGMEMEWDVRFPENQYNVRFPGTWLRPRPELDADVNVTNIACYGDNTGVFEVTAVNSTPDYTWTYSNGTVNTHAGPTDQINLPSGYYSVTLTDIYGCTISKDANILDANAPLESTIRAENVLCHGEATGNIFVTVYGGLPPYTFEWSNGSTEQNPQGVTPGTYTVTITDAVGCELEDQVVVTEPDESLSIIDDGIQHITCYGMSNGSVEIIVTGGTPGYSYLWSNGYAVQDLHNIPAGSYTVTVTDANGCIAIATYVVEGPSPLTVDINANDVLCYADNTGNIDIIVTGGNAPYTYSWSNGETSSSLTGLYAGYYIVTVTDAHGCEAVAMAQINQPALPLYAEIVATDVRCYGEADGLCDLNVSGGSQPYYYTWNTGAISEDIDNLVPGDYIVTVTDANGCLAYDTVHIYQSPNPLSGYISGNKASCYGASDGNVRFTADGGYEPYHYEWSNGSWEQNLNGVPAGTYTVTVTDANSCKKEYTYVVNEPEPFYIQMMDDFTICYGMTTQIGAGIVSGGVSPYTMTWSNGETVDSMSINVTPLETTTYYATITDAANCSSEEVEVTVYVLDSISMRVELMTDSVVCAGEKVAFDIEVSGGNNNGDVYVNGDIVVFPYEPVIMSDTTFTFVVYDSCRFNRVEIPVNVYVFDSIPINISADIMEGCAPLTVNFEERTPDVGQTYFWNFADGDFENMSFAKSPTHTFYNSGTYHVTLEVTSANECRRVDTVPITVFSVPEADFLADRTNVSLASPVVNFTNYTHGGFWNLWDFGDKTTSSESNPVHIYTMPGNYHVVLTTTSLYGCTDTAGVNIVVSNEHAIFAPTAFTPNNDEVNETFRIFGNSIDVENYSIVIYDRWGTPLFKSNKFEEEWDGTDGIRPCPTGVYTWRIYYKDMFGNDYEKTGTVTLLR